MYRKLLTTRAFSEVMGVSESSVKRWADEGTLRVHRTAGGHRRIALREAVRFIRETGAAVVQPHVLGLPDVGAIDPGSTESDEEALFRWLRQGDGARARGLLQSRYLEGASVAALLDGPVRGALARLGELWTIREEGIFEEHRALDLLLHTLRRLAELLRQPEAGAPTALGGAPSDDPHLVPSLGVWMVLTEAGFHAVNLGPDTPVSGLLAGAQRLSPRLVWVSVSSLSTRDLAGYWRRTLEGLSPETTLVVGGRHLRDHDRIDDARLVALGSMTELEAFLEGTDWR